ncbi:MAG TPA: hypothetical protein VFQ44_20520 [Streptosporangiaceae bacterium]|nr:hypothetical protein [Streptosporangiaceae bacterium]
MHEGRPEIDASEEVLHMESETYDDVEFIEFDDTLLGVSYYRNIQ